MGNVISQPEVSLNIIAADLAVNNAPQRALIIAPKTSGGSATANVVFNNVPNDGSENGLFGRTSIAAAMVRMFKRIAPMVQLDVIPVADNAGGVAAAYTLTFAGTATEAGSVEVIAGSAKYCTVTAAVASGAAASAVATSVAAAINANLDCHFTASPAGAVVTLTADNDGSFGNSMPIAVKLIGAVSGLLAGITVTVAQSVTGSVDPVEFDSSAILDQVSNVRYQTVLTPGIAAAIHTAIDARFNVNNKVIDGVCITPLIDTYANLLVVGNAVNVKTLTLIGDKKNSTSPYFGPGNQEPGYFQTTAFAAIRARRLTDGASLTQYLTTNASGDQFGGPALASLPYFNTNIPELSVTREGAGFTELEIEGLLTAGVSILGSNVNRTNVLAGEMATTYKTDPAGNADPSFKFLNYVDTMSNIREYYFNNLKKRFAQSRLTEGSVIRSRSMANRAIIEAYLDQLYGDLTGPDFVLCQAGEAARKFFQDNRSVVLDLATGTVTIAMRVPIVTQNRRMVGTVQIAFSTEG